MVLQDLFNNIPEALISDNREEYLINFNHLGLLYCMDIDKDG